MFNKLVVQTHRCEIRHADLDDADFIIKLLNQKSFIDNIGDKQVRDRKSAYDYIKRSFQVQYQAQSFAPYIVCLKTGQKIGIAGFYQRSYLQGPDLGYAFLDEYTGQGLASEACIGLISLAKSDMQLSKLYAVTDMDNMKSQRLLRSLGFEFNGKIICQADKIDSLFTYKFI
ncbi:GNAT family N-acetyltransferase [Pseudoalteromonas luteoviolacea]|uniref:GNAT family N-acetyltransferase n=1 Tax=Pseudoalteromonas luteoviolacea TaxID=43657 RepID=UPI001F36D12D|nr:GNAT family N-acetyltransferase [Pseudoalteromonas luteoviolacea]MCF6439614.1 GNAT family N-acetyltransferase [Pseudoalteromonas luteoviolacea]